MERVVLLMALALAAGGCGDEFSSESQPVEPADFAGNYSVNVVNGDNGCVLPNWNEGETATGVPLTIEQEGASATATVEGLAGTSLNLWIGSNRLSGTVSGSDMTLTLLGAPRTHEGCESIVDATYLITLAGDAISGDATYRRQAVDGTCTFVEPCESYQELSGARPPQ